MNKTLAITAIALVAGSIMAGGMAYAINTNADPFQEFSDAIDDLQRQIDTIEGSPGAGIPISMGSNNMESSSFTCVDETGSPRDGFITVFEGGVVLLSDGTVKVASPTGGLTNPNPLFGSLPAGVWVDIEGTYSNRTTPDDCEREGEESRNSQVLDACAVNEEGDIWCVQGSIFNGGLGGATPVWTFQADAIP